MRASTAWMSVLCAALLGCGSPPISFGEVGPLGPDGSTDGPGPGPSDPGPDRPGGPPIRIPPGQIDNPPIGTPGPWALPALQTEVPVYELTIPEATLKMFMEDVWTKEQPATFTWNGQSWPIEVRLRGRSSRFFPKKSWEVEFPKTALFQGRRKLNLVGMYQDSTMLVEKLGLDLLAAMGGPATRAQYVRLYINGTFQGVYLDIEQVDKHFLRAHGFDDDANIYRCGTHDCEMKLFVQPYQSDWEKKTNEDQPRTDLDAFLQFVNRAPEPDFPERLAERMDVEAYLTTMVVDALISNMTLEDSGSYLVHDRVARRWTYVPWDLNNANSRFWPSYSIGDAPIVDHPIFVWAIDDAFILEVHARRSVDPAFPDYLPAFNTLTTRFAKNPALRERALARLERALDELFTEESMHARIDAIHALIDPFMKDDPVISHDAFRYGKAYLKRYVSERIAFLREEIVRLRSETPPLVIDAFHPAAGWIELRNVSDHTVGTGGLELRTNLRRPGKSLPPRQIAPGESVRFTAAELGLQFAPEGEIGVFQANTVLTNHDLLYYGQLGPGEYYRRDGDEWEIAR